MTPIKAYRIHPDTGEDANDFDTASFTTDERAELAREVRHGAKFYWIREDLFAENQGNGPWSKIERANYAFVANVMGQKVEWVD
jgi:hypothetical protein